MKRLLAVIFLLMSFVSYAQNTEILEIISRINQDSIMNNVKALENFQTRFAFADNNKEIVLYLQDRMRNYGFEVQIDSFYAEDCAVWKDNLYFNGWQYNVSCTKKSSEPMIYDSVLILGAHYDCISNMDGFLDYAHYAPGADDNASGVACLLELARVWADCGINRRQNLNIEFYAAEELNLTGSNARLHSLSSPWQMYVTAMINLDMVGYDTSSVVALNYYDNSNWLTALAMENTADYTNLSANLTQEFIERSDSWNFYAWGINALFISENDFSPYYHTLQDSSVYLNYGYMKEITALAASLAYNITNNIDNVGLIQPDARNISLFNDKNTLNISINNPSSLQITVSDINGRILLSSNFSGTRFAIPISQFNDGMYIVKITAPQFSVSRKFVK